MLRSWMLQYSPLPCTAGQVGKTAYGRILRMGFPLPSAEVVAASMDRAAAENVQWGLVEVLENRATGSVQVSRIGSRAGGWRERDG